MEQSLQYQLPLRRSWVREIPAASSNGPKIAFVLFIAFLVMLYSNIAVIYKAQLDALRPTLVVALSALSMMVIELGQKRQAFRLMWPQGVLLIAFLGVCVVSTFNAIYIRHAADTTIDFAKIVLVYLLIENVVTTETRLRKVALTMVCCGLFPAIGVIYHYKTGILVEQSRAAWRGIFGNPNEAAYGLLVLIPLALALASTSRLPVRLALWALVGVFLVAMFFTFSRGGFLGLFAVLGLMAWKYDSMIIKVGMIGALIAGIVVVGMFWKRSSGDFSNIKEDTSVQERMYTFHAAIQMFLHNPVLGVGPGDSLVAYPIYAPMAANCGCHNQLVVHNTYLQALGELGALGFGVYILFIGIPVYQAWKMQRGAMRPYAVALELAMWGFLICSLSGGYVYTWWPYILVGLITATKRISDSNTTAISARGVHGI
jgi:putative inorganic carbon (hco3(-)) transporter